MKTLTSRQVSAIKRIAKNVNPLIIKRDKLMDKIDSIRTEIESINDEINGHEMGVQIMTGGLVSEDLVTKRVIDTGKFDAEGKPIKKTDYFIKENALRLNPDTNLYEIIYDNNLVEDVNIDNINMAETAPEVEVKAGEEAPINPLEIF